VALNIRLVEVPETEFAKATILIRVQKTELTVSDLIICKVIQWRKTLRNSNNAHTPLWLFITTQHKPGLLLMHSKQST